MPYFLYGVQYFGGRGWENNHSGALLLHKPRKISSWEEDKFLNYPNERKISRRSEVPENSNSTREFCANLEIYIPSAVWNISSQKQEEYLRECRNLDSQYCQEFRFRSDVPDGRFLPGFFFLGIKFREEIFLWISFQGVYIPVAQNSRAFLANVAKKKSRIQRVAQNSLPLTSLIHIQ